MQAAKPDISSRDDIIPLLQIFYARAGADDLLGEKFANVKMDEHIELIADFWETVLFGTRSYQGDPFGKHVPLALEPPHFDRWVEIFTATIDEFFGGPKAEEMKMRGQTIAQVFQHKLKHLQP